MMAIQAAIAAGGAAIKGGLSAAQAAKAKKLGATERPIATIPKESEDALREAQLRYNAAGINPQAVGLIEGTTANQLSTLGKLGTNTATMLGALGNVTNAENEAKIGLVNQGVERKASAFNTYLDQLNSIGEMRRKNWEWNAAQPYLNAMEAGKVQRAASGANAAGAIGDITGGINAAVNTGLTSNALGLGGMKLSPNAQLESQMAEQAQESANPMGGMFKTPAPTTNIANPMDNTILAGGTPIKLNPTTAINTKTDGTVLIDGKPMDYNAAQKLIDNDAAFGVASGNSASKQAFDIYEALKGIDPKILQSILKGQYKFR